MAAAGLRQGLPNADLACLHTRHHRETEARWLEKPKQKVFSNYRKVVTKSQGNLWFGVLPETPANVVPITAVA